MFRLTEKQTDAGVARDGDKPGLSRRRFLALAACGVAWAVFPGAAAARQTTAKTRKLAFENLHTGDRLSAVYWENGTYIPDALEAFDQVLRDHRTGEACPMAPRLLDLVHSVTARLGTTAPVQVISGYRSPATNALLHADDPGGVATRSLHLTGEAIDLRFGNRPLRRVRAAALSLQAGGVGYYPRSNFVHLDVGRPRRW